jgi:hypothetical protein
MVARPSVRSTGLLSSRPIRAFPAASANMTDAVSAVQAIPGSECPGWYEVASTTLDWMTR